MTSLLSMRIGLCSACARVRLDLLIPTFRRETLLLRLLASITEAFKRGSVDLRVIVIDNDATGDLPVLRQWLDGTPSLFPIRVVHEPRPGKSTALNTALSIASADYVGFLDDDEELDPSWFRVVARELAGGTLDFLGGRSLPLWDAPPPRWLPRDSPAVLGIVDPGVPGQLYSRHFPGILSGGNAVVRLDVMRRLGGFAAELGPRRERRLLSGEDEDLYWRLLDSGAPGRYVPDMVVFHRVHPERLHRRYFRAWHFWNGTAKGLLSRSRPQAVSSVGGVPRYLVGEALRGVLRWALTLATRDADRRLSHELPCWLLAGFVYGRYFHDTIHEPSPMEVREATLL
jgi:glycosyltransferase involved in cell wall biosynthesis